MPTDELRAAVLLAIGAYTRAWNERDPARRAALLTAALTDRCAIVAPVGVFTGAREIDAEIARWHTALPGHSAAFADAGDVHHGWARVTFEERSPDGRVTARGIDIFELAPDGRIQRVVTFLDP